MDNQKESDKIVTDNSKVMLLFSGGRDSVLSAARLASSANQVYLVTFDDGLIKSMDYRDRGVNILKDACNDCDCLGSIYDSGVRNICGIWQMLIRPVLNMSFTALAGDYSAMTGYQTYKLVSRTAMVVAAGIMCKSLGISSLAVGDKMGDVCSVQHSSVFELHKNMLKELYGVTYVRPVWDVEDEFEVKSELMMRDLPTEVLKPQCLIECSASDLNVDTHLADQACASLWCATLYPVIEKAKDTWKKML